MTLSRFLREYLYIPLGGNRKGKTRRLVNLMLTMVLGGLWHGAGWTFVFWGALHGFYLVVNHGWRIVMIKSGHPKLMPEFVRRNVSWLLTFIAVLVSWVFFRAETFQGAVNILAAMSLAGNDLPIANGASFISFPSNLIENPMEVWVLFISLLIFVRYSPNTLEWVSSKGSNMYFWSGRTVDAIAIALLFAISIFHIQSYSEFLYFQF